jgi:hypothetical protein
VDDRADQLFTLSPDEFVAARDALAAELRNAGDRDGAAEVKALRRPTVGAWAINQVSRRHSDEVNELLAAGRDLRKAQRAAMAGSGGTDVHAAAARRRAAVDRLARLTGEVLQEAGRGGGLHPEIADTFLAASVEADVEEAVRAGRLDRERRPSADVAELLGLAAPDDESSAGRPGSKSDGKRAPARPEPTGLKQAERDARQARRDADRAATRAENARRSAQVAKDHAVAKERAAREAETDARAAVEAAVTAERKLQRLRGRRS